MLRLLAVAGISAPDEESSFSLIHYNLVRPIHSSEHHTI